MSAETKRIKERLLEATEKTRKGFPEFLFRINAGIGWVATSKDTIKKRKGKDTYVILKNPRRLIAAPQGWPDICGFESVTVTQDMVGKKVAVFKFVEVKLTENWKPNQKEFLELVNSMGGFTEIIRQ